MTCGSSVKVRLCISLSCAPTVTLHSTGLASTSLKSRRYPNDGLDLHVQYLEALQSCALCSQDHLALDIRGYLPGFLLAFSPLNLPAIFRHCFFRVSMSFIIWYLDHFLLFSWSNIEVFWRLIRGGIIMNNLANKAN